MIEERYGASMDLLELGPSSPRACTAGQRAFCQLRVFFEPPCFGAQMVAVRCASCRHPKGFRCRGMAGRLSSRIAPERRGAFGAGCRMSVGLCSGGGWQLAAGPVRGSFVGRDATRLRPRVRSMQRLAISTRAEESLRRDHLENMAEWRGLPSVCQTTCCCC